MPTRKDHYDPAVGQRIRAAVDAGYRGRPHPYQDFASDLGTNRSEVSQIFAGAIPNGRRLRKIHELTRASLDYLLLGVTVGDARQRDLPPLQQELIRESADLDARAQQSLVEIARLMRRGSQEVTEHLMRQVKLLEQVVEFADQLVRTGQRAQAPETEPGEGTE